MKNNFLVTLFLLISILMLSSCTKEHEYFTSGQLIGIKLQQIIIDNNIELVERRTTDRISSGLAYASFEIKDEMIRIKDYWYNLNYLAYTDIQTHWDEIAKEDKNKLVLFFGFPTN